MSAMGGKRTFVVVDSTWPVGHHSDMHRTAQSILGILCGASAMVALTPYFEFLVAPPAEKAARWAVTVVALGVLGFSALLLKQVRAKEYADNPKD
jgi:hypothetical protein